MPFNDYIHKMSKDGTYGDEITLRAIAEIFNNEISVISTLGRGVSVMIKPEESIPLTRITIGHFAEGQGLHPRVYVSDPTLRFRIVGGSE